MNRPGRRFKSRNCLNGHVGRYLNVMIVACFAFLFRHGYAASSRTAHMHGIDNRAVQTAGVRGLEGRGSIDVTASRRAQDGDTAATAVGSFETPCQDLKFHPEEVSGTGCTNSLDYPQEWNDPAALSYIFFDTAAACCDTYYANNECIITDVCVATTIATAPTVSLSPTPAPIESLDILELTPSPSSSLMPTPSDTDTATASTTTTVPTVSLSPTPEFGEEAEGFSRESLELVTTPSPSSSLMPAYSDTVAGTKNTIEIAALFAFVFPDAAWDDDRLSIMQIVVKQYFDYENDKLNVPFGIELSLGDRFEIRPATNPLNETQEGNQVDITFLLTVDADSLASSYIDEALFRDIIFNILQRSDEVILQEISNAWEIQFGEKAEGLSLEILELTPTPSPASTFMPTDVSQIGDSMFEIPILFTFIFPDPTFWRDSYVTGLELAMKNFLSDQDMLNSINLEIDADLGNMYGIVSGLDYVEPVEDKEPVEDVEPAEDEGEGGGENSQEGRKVQITIVIRIPMVELTGGYVSSDFIVGLIEEAFITSARKALVYMSQELNYDLEKNGVLLSVNFLSVAPTSFPTYAPTTLAYHNKEQQKQKVRSWTFMTIFWLIVVTCFALENGLCACKCLCRKKQEFQSS